ENRTLGQLERDLHDGPQQRLVRLQMDLAAAERRLSDDPAAAAQLLGEARGTAKDTLDELRALSRGFAPPILGDRGLPAALQTLAARGPMPVDLTVTARAALSPELERNLYFVAAELLTNAAKHSGAERVSIALVDGLHAATVELTVRDQGSGGIVEVPGHGVAGLAERLRGIGGSLRVSSPAGGPSVVTATVPVSLGA
ncbi:sensor histidine kinase, partial [Leucobacter sp. M11]|uniref:sensor histidine kinase n=1 Tax=Leucobacter sp. M11 TaxID=2993565 RepID=UPI002D7EFC78